MLWQLGSVRRLLPNSQVVRSRGWLSRAYVAVDSRLWLLPGVCFQAMSRRPVRGEPEFLWTSITDHIAYAKKS